MRRGKRIFALVLAAVLALSVCGCGDSEPAGGTGGVSTSQGGGPTQGGNAGQGNTGDGQGGSVHGTDAQGAGQGTNTPGEDGQGSAGGSGSAGTASADMQVVIYSSKRADFIIEDAYFEPGSQGSCSVQFALQDGNYKVGLYDFGGETLQCTLYRQIDEDQNIYRAAGSCSYSYDGNQLTISVDLGDFDIKGSFKKVTEYALENGTQEKGFAHATFAAENVAKGGDGSAEDDEPDDDAPLRYRNLWYEYDGSGGIIITEGYLGSGDIIPNEIDGKPVREIRERAFARRGLEIENLIIPSNVTVIGEDAFYKNTGIKGITLPEGLEVIGRNAFGYCGFSSVSIPGSVESIGDYAFTNCENLTSLTISEGVADIGDSAFYGCGSLQGVSIPGSVETIGASAFGACESLASLTLGEGIREIGEEAFEKCGITSVTIPESLETYGDSVFQECRSLASVTLPSSMETVIGGMFYRCESLIDVTIPEGVTEIEYFAFAGCTSLANVTLPSSLQTIGNSAFAGIGCSSINIPDGVTSIGNRAFASSQLTSITVPDSVASIGDGAFEACPRLKSASLPGGVKLGYDVFFCSPTVVTYR